MNDNTDGSVGPTLNLADRGLLSLAYPYALDAISTFERAEIDTRLLETGAETRRAFLDAVRGLHETMAAAAAATAARPPPELRARILDALDRVQQEQAVVREHADGAVPSVDDQRARQARWPRYAAAAVAAILLGLGGVVGVQLVDNRRGADSEQVLLAQDSKTVAAAVSPGGTATITYSRQRDTALVRFDGVPPPVAGSVYQMWLFNGPSQSVGTLTAAELASDTRRTVTGVRTATMFAVTVEPVGGSVAPTTSPIAFVALTA